MQIALENRKKATIDSLRSALKRKNKVEEGGALRLRNEKGIGEHKFEGTKNDEGQSETIYSTNSGKGNATSGPNS
jgi:hypothetical protein